MIPVNVLPLTRHALRSSKGHYGFTVRDDKHVLTTSLYYRAIQVSPYFAIRVYSRCNMPFYTGAYLLYGSDNVAGLSTVDRCSRRLTCQI